MSVPDKVPQKTALFPLLALAGLVFLLFFYGLGHYAFFDVDEPRYAEAAREMMESGNWITPYFNYVVRFDKPVFFYWLVAFAYKLFGVSEFSARLVSALAGAGIVFMVYAFGRAAVSSASSRFALFSALVLATCIQMVGLSRMSITDMTLAAFMTGTTLSLYGVAQHSKKWWLVAGLFSALSILTKGPVGLVVPGGILIVYALLTGQFKQCFLNRWFPLALLLVAAIAFPWFYLAYQQNGQPFIDALFLHNVTRFNDVVTGHDQPWYFFIMVLLAGFMPWTPFFLVSLSYWVPRLLKDLRNPDSLYRVTLFSLVWGGFIFVFFSASNTKLLTYILPMFPAAALVLGSAFYQASEHHDKDLQKGFFGASVFLLVVLAIAGPLFVTQAGSFMPREARHLTDLPEGILVVALLLAGATLMTIFFSRKQVYQGVVLQSALMAAAVAVAFTTLVPQINQVTQGAMLSFVAQADGEPLITYEIQRPSLTYYTRKKIPHVALDDHAKLGALLQQSGGQLFIITKKGFLDEIRTAQPAKTKLDIVDQQQVYALLRLKALN